MINRQIDIEIVNYLADECTPADSIRIAGLLQTDKDYQKVYTELKQIWDAPQAIPISDSYHVDAAWEQVSTHMNEHSLKVLPKSTFQKTISSPWVRYISGAAAILLLGFVVFFLNRQDVSMKTMASGTSINIPVTLSDGSHISLYKSSEVKYPEKFGNTSREVYFWGEAFFEIASDPTRPFVIESGDARIKVLGTSFNVKAMPGSDMTEVVVNTGKVLFYHVDENNIILNQIELVKGEKGIYNHKTHLLSRFINKDLNFISWKTGILIFNETTLDKVMETVGKKYDVTFHLSDAQLAELKLTATFDNESLDSVLEVLSLVHKLQFTHNGKDYLVAKVAG